MNEAMNTVIRAESESPLGNVLLLSQRRIANLVAYCLAYEFEDTLQELTGAQRLEATDMPALEFSRRAYKLARGATGSAKLARRIAPYPRSRVILDQDYDFFFPIFSHTHELYSLAMIPNWRQRCRHAACFITEVWSDLLPPYLVELMSQFDHIFIGFHHSVADVARMTGRPCTYLPLAADVPRFSPATITEDRPISVCNIGRRSAVTHQALLADAERRQSFYYYDTVTISGEGAAQRTFGVQNPREHRGILASILKRSRYYIANRSRVNEPEFTHGREEISARFYEGAAAGTIMIGEAPRSDEFRSQFDWPDAVMHLPFDSPDVVEILDELDRDPARLLAIRRNSVAQAAQRHDWLHRINVIFEVLGLPPTDAMQTRARSLEQIAARALMP